MTRPIRQDGRCADGPHSPVTTRPFLNFPGSRRPDLGRTAEVLVVTIAVTADPDESPGKWADPENDSPNV